MDSIPLVCLSGEVPTSLIGSDAFQECDTVGITRPCTKHNWLVKDVNELAGIIHEAFRIAQTGRPAPSLSIFRRTSSSPPAPIRRLPPPFSRRATSRRFRAISTPFTRPSN